MKIANEVIKLLKENNLTIGSVESLTAGLFSASLASIPGSSSVLKGALVTYQSSFKCGLLKIKKDRIDKFGVVSKEIASDMATKGYEILKTDIVVSCTGNAGPTKEIGGADVGTVFVAIYSKKFTPNLIILEKHYSLERNALRVQLVNDILDEIKILFVKMANSL